MPRFILLKEVDDFLDFSRGKSMKPSISSGWPTVFKSLIPLALLGLSLRSLLASRPPRSRISRVRSLTSTCTALTSPSPSLAFLHRAVTGPSWLGYGLSVFWRLQYALWMSFLLPTVMVPVFSQFFVVSLVFSRSHVCAEVTLGWTGGGSICSTSLAGSAPAFTVSRASGSEQQ